MLVLDVAEDVQDCLDGIWVSGNVHEVAGQERPKRHDEPRCFDHAVCEEQRADGGPCRGDVGEEAVGGRGREVVVCEAVADEDGEENEGGHWVEALGLAKMIVSRWSSLRWC